MRVKTKFTPPIESTHWSGMKALQTLTNVNTPGKEKFADGGKLKRHVMATGGEIPDPKKDVSVTRQVANPDYAAWFKGATLDQLKSQNSGSLNTVTRDQYKTNNFPDFEMGINKQLAQKFDNPLINSVDVGSMTPYKWNENAPTDSRLLSYDINTPPAMDAVRDKNFPVTAPAGLPDKLALTPPGEKMRYSNTAQYAPDKSSLKDYINTVRNTAMSDRTYNQGVKARELEYQKNLKNKQKNLAVRNNIKKSAIRPNNTDLANNF